MVYIGSLVDDTLGNGPLKVAEEGPSVVLPIFPGIPVSPPPALKGFIPTLNTVPLKNSFCEEPKRTNTISQPFKILKR
jgi:hypothetical protein